MRWVLLALLTSCARAPRPGDATVDLLVVAPHPDDEVLMATAHLTRAIARSERVSVIVLTNGDFTCHRDGRVRQAETVAALADLGVPEHRVHFLGYPDGHLHELGTHPLEVTRRDAQGRCSASSVTWATRGAGFTDSHSLRTGHPGPLTADGVVDDLSALLAAAPPRDVVVPHGIDGHADHAMTYVFLRRALDRTRATPRLHRSLIHAADPCWPGGCAAPLRLDARLPPLPPPLEGYQADERLPVDAAAKLALLAHYPSQLDGPLEGDWLAGFARTDEAFFTERCAAEATRVVCQPPDATRNCDDTGCRATRRDGYEETTTWLDGTFTGTTVTRPTAPR